MSDLEAFRARIRTLEHLLEVQEAVALRQTTRLEALLTEQERTNAELEMAEAALRASEARQRAIVQASLDAIVTIDLQGRIEEFSAAAERMFGFDRAEVLGKPIAEVIIPERFRQAHQDGIERYRRTGEGPVLEQRIEISAIRRDGSEFPVELTIVPAQVEQETRFTGFVRDITVAKRDAERLRQLQLLTDAALGSLTLDALLPELVARIKQMLAPDVAAILLLDDEGMLVMAAGIGVPDEPPYRIAVGHGFAGRVARAREPIAIEDVQALDDLSENLRKSGVRSMLGVSLLVEDRLVGVLQIGDREPRTFTADETDLVARIGQRISLAIQHARAYERERHIAHTLQMSLLPSHIAEIPGLEFSVRYVPSVEGATVGGDWYDVVPLPGGTVGVGIGDVMGRGAAAAAVMGRLRYATRAYAVEGDAPEVVLARLNHLVLRTKDAELATMVYAVIDPATGDVSFASAGHPMPLLVCADGASRFLELPPVPPIGVDSATAFTRGTVRLEAGDALVLYTDGLIEQRGEDIDRGMERLRAAIPARVVSAQAASDAIASVLMPSGPGDDAAYLVVRRVVAGARLERPGITIG